jgi:hypothetical protein
MKSFVIIIGMFLTLSLSAQTDGVGINTTDPKSTLDINGNLSVKHIKLTPADGSLQPISDGVYISIDPFTSGQQFQLPDATEFPGRIYILRNIGITTLAWTLS